MNILMRLICVLLLTPCMLVIGGRLRREKDLG